MKTVVLMCKNGLVYTLVVVVVKDKCEVLLYLRRYVFGCNSNSGFKEGGLVKACLCER